MTNLSDGVRVFVRDESLYIYETLMFLLIKLRWLIVVYPVTDDYNNSVNLADELAIIVVLQCLLVCLAFNDVSDCKLPNYQLMMGIKKRP